MLTDEDLHCIFFGSCEVPIGHFCYEGDGVAACIDNRDGSHINSESPDVVPIPGAVVLIIAAIGILAHYGRRRA